MVVPFVRFLQSRPVRGLAQADLDNLWRRRARMDFEQGIPVNPANRPVAPLETLYPESFPSFEAQGFRVPSGVSPTTRPILTPGIEDVTIRPSIAESYEPRIATGQPFEEEALRQWQSGAFEPRDVTVGLRGGGEMRYVPLTADEVKDIERAVAEDPGRAYLSVLMNYDEATNPQEFGRAMEQARALRQNIVMDPQYEAALNSALARAAQRFGVPDTVYEDLVSPILYTNSRQLPRQVSRVGSELEEVTEASVTSNKFRIDTNKAIKNAKRSADLDDIDTKNGGVVGRALASGEISEMDAKSLVNQTNYTRVRLLQNEGILPKGFKNNVRAKGGKRGIDLLDNMSELSDVNKARLYKVAIQTAETNDEVAQVYALAVSDLKSPALLDELESVLDGKASYFGRIEGIVPDRLARPVETIIDEASIRSANVEQTAFDARRAAADETRPAFPSDEVTPEDTIVNAFLATDEKGKKQFVRTKLGEKEKWVRGEDGERVPVTLGGGKSRLISSEDLAREASYPEPKNKNPWNMTFRDSETSPMRPEFAGMSTMDLVLDGVRTGTTRASNYNVKAGDVIDFTDEFGRIARVRVTKAPYQLPEPLSADHRNRLAARWSELEGWDPSLYDRYIGDWQFQYELIGEVKGPRFPT